MDPRLAALIFCLCVSPSFAGKNPAPAHAPVSGPALEQSPDEERRKSEGCLSCHEGIEPMHPEGTVRLGCTDCHGGKTAAAAPAGSRQGDAAYERAKKDAHVAPHRRDVF